MKILHWLKRQYYKRLSISGSLMSHRLNGKFRVMYKDGEISQPFSYKVAKSYASIFGGEIIDNQKKQL